MVLNIALNHVFYIKNIHFLCNMYIKTAFSHYYKAFITRNFVKFVQYANSTFHWFAVDYSVALDGFSPSTGNNPSKKKIAKPFSYFLK